MHAVMCMLLYILHIRRVLHSPRICIVHPEKWSGPVRIENCCHRRRRCNFVSACVCVCVCIVNDNTRSSSQTYIYMMLDTVLQWHRIALAWPNVWAIAIFGLSKHKQKADWNSNIWMDKCIWLHLYIPIYSPICTCTCTSKTISIPFKIECISWAFRLCLCDNSGTTKFKIVSRFDVFVVACLPLLLLLFLHIHIPLARIK